MDLIINFFKSIDGIPYYIMVVVNAILIFAIIGYLGEKNNEKILKMSMNVGPSNLKSGTMNLNVTHSSPVPTASIPQVAATQVQQAVPVNNSVNSNVVNNTNNPIPVVSNNQVVNNPIPTINNTQNNENQNEKAPDVLVINSSSVNKDVK